MSVTTRIKDGVKPIVLVHGDATVLVEQKVKLLVAWGKERCGPPGFNLESWSATDARAESALQSARTPPMMAPLRVVVLRDLELASDQLFLAVAEYAAAPVDDTLLVLSSGKLPSMRTRKGLSKDWSKELPRLLAQTGDVFQYLNAQINPERFATEVASSFGVQLGRRQAAHLIAVVGTDLGLLREEARKLSIYVGNRTEVRDSDISEVCSMLADAVVWQMTTGIAAQKPKVALEALHRLLDAGDPPHKLLGLVAWQLRGVVSSLEALRRGAGDSQAARAGGLKPDVFRVVKTQAHHWQQGDLARTIEKLAATNMAMNSRRIGDRRAFESLVLELCQA